MEDEWIINKANLFYNSFIRGLSSNSQKMWKWKDRLKLKHIALPTVRCLVKKCIHSNSFFECLGQQLWHASLPQSLLVDSWFKEQRQKRVKCRSSKNIYYYFIIICSQLNLKGSTHESKDGISLQVVFPENNWSVTIRKKAESHFSRVFIDSMSLEIESIRNIFFNKFRTNNEDRCRCRY